MEQSVSWEANSQSVKKMLMFYEPEGSHEPDPGLYPEPNKSSPHLTTLFL
jgi:hypothetical protein